MAERLADLAHLPIVSRLTPAQRERVLETGREQRLERGGILFHEGEPAQAMYAVLEGQMKLVRLSPQGKELLLHLVHPGQTFAEAALFGRATYPATAQAVDDTRLWCIPRDRLVELIRSSPELGLAMLASISLWTRLLVSKLDLLTQHRVEERLAVYLMGKAPPGTLEAGDEITLQDPRNLIAAQIGTAPEVLSRTLRRLEDEGILRVTAGGVTVVDAERLRDLARWIGEE